MDHGTNRTACPVCRTPNASRSGVGGNTFEIQCARCGRYHIQALAETQLINGPPAFPPMHLLSGVCRNVWDALSEKLLITVDVFKSWAELTNLAKLPVPRDCDVAVKADYVLRFIRRRSRSLADVVRLGPAELAVGFCANKRELQYCLDYLVARGLVEAEQESGRGKGQSRGDSLAYRLTPTGWAALDGAQVTVGVPPQAAVVLGGSGAAEALWTQGIAAALESAGYRALRLDARSAGNRVADELIVEVRRSALVVADLTGQSTLAFFVGGLATGLGKPLFWCCEEGESGDKKCGLDTRQQLLITWTRERLDEFKLRLAHRIEATLGRPRADV